ncbi:MAG: sulfate adenylyltransferase, partial [Promethearchaeota archaeon]
MIQPHGNTLINKELPKIEKQRILGEIDEFFTKKVNAQTSKVIKNIAFGVFSPLEGFMNSNNYHYVLKEMYLENNVAWPFPIVLGATEAETQEFGVNDSIILMDETETPLAIMNISDIYSFNKKEFAQVVYGTLDRNHPGVESVYNLKDKLIGGEIFLLNEPTPIFPNLDLKPMETRVLFKQKKWDKVVAFQTRNPPHL